jgi:signal transduction histidine kinase
VTNSVRHGSARHIWVALRVEADTLHLAVQDDGRASNGLANAGGGHGLFGIRERLQALGGELETRAAAGSGFQLEARLPWRPEA